MLAIVFELWGAVTAVRGSWAIQGVLGEGNYANHVRNHQQANRSLTKMVVQQTKNTQCFMIMA